MTLNNEMLTTSGVCPNTAAMLKEAMDEETVAAIVVDIGARASAVLPPGLDNMLGFDLVDRKSHGP
jgi:hypothetical protein